MDNNKIIYDHASVPPKGIELNKYYFVEDIFDKLNISDELLKELFRPVDGVWETVKKETKRRMTTKKATE